jgi:glycerophosphoryl diester phosphodiesterase
LAGPPLGFAHRGFTPPAPGRSRHAWENTLAAFRAARALGIRHLEMDVRATRDGVCAVVHDPDLSRIAGVDARVRDLTWEEVSRVRVGGEHRVPRLEDVLDAFPDAVLNVDCKTDDTVQPLIRVLRGRPDASRVIVAAFDGGRSAAVALAVPAVARGAGPGTVGTAVVAGWLARIGLRAPGRWLLRAARRGSHALQVPERWRRLHVVSPAFVATAHAVGLQVHVWVVDDPADMRSLLDLGVDGLISDRVDRLAEVLRERAGPR